VLLPSLAQAARECGVSDITTLRFCYDAGFQGYTKLNLSIIQDIVNPILAIQDDIVEGDNLGIVVHAGFFSAAPAVLDEESLMDGMALVELRDMVLEVFRSGISIAPVLTLKEAKKNGSSTFCITGNSHSDITEYADVTLIGMTRESRNEAMATPLA